MGFITDQLAVIPPSVLYLVQILAVASLACLALRLARFVWRSFLNPGHNLRKRYGGGWAVVTGATYGIGSGYAAELAKRGLNVFLIARSEGPLKEMAEDLSTKYNVQADYMAADFLAAPYDAIAERLRDVDVSILVNNVGMTNKVFGKFHQNDMEEHRRITKLNTESQTMMTRILLPQMQRRKKSAVISLSSFSSVVPAPYLAVYAGTKGYNGAFSNAVAAEYPRIDWQVVRPGYVASKLTRTRKASFFIPLPTWFAAASLRQLGVAKDCSPWWTHEVFRMMYLLGMMTVKTSMQMFEKQRQRQLAKLRG